MQNKNTEQCGSLMMITIKCTVGGCLLRESYQLHLHFAAAAQLTQQVNQWQAVTWDREEEEKAVAAPHEAPSHPITSQPAEHQGVM